MIYKFLSNFLFNDLKQQSSRAGEAMMRSNWETFDTSIQRSLVLITTVGAKPIQLSAGKIYKVNVEYFRTVMGTAFSYYTLLKKLKEKNLKV